MANYVERNLRKDEKIVLRAKISWLTLVVPVIWCVLVEVLYFYLMNKLEGASSSSSSSSANAAGGQIKTILLIVCQLFALVPLIKQILINTTTHLAITNKRVVGKTGILRVLAFDYPINKIDNVTYGGGIFGNLFKYYTVVVQSSSSDKAAIKAISNAQAFKNAVTEAVERYADEARKAQAAEIAAAMGNKPQM